MNLQAQIMEAIQEAHTRYLMSLLVCPYLRHWTSKLWKIWKKVESYARACRATRIILMLDDNKQRHAIKQVKGVALLVTHEVSHPFFSFH